MAVIELNDGMGNPENYSEECPLNERELKMLGLLALGFPYREIAAEFGISKHYVKKLASEMYQKAGCDTAVHCVATAIRKGWIK